MGTARTSAASSAALGFRVYAATTAATAASTTSGSELCIVEIRRPCGESGLSADLLSGSDPSVTRSSSTGWRMCRSSFDVRLSAPEMRPCIARPTSAARSIAGMLARTSEGSLR